MNHMMLICSDGIATEEKSATMAAHLMPYVEEVRAGGRLLYGHRLDVASSARTVRVRDGQTLVSDGPFAESKEFVAGFDLLDVADTDEAVALAAKHPVSWFHAIEVRELGGCEAGRVLDPPSDQLLNGPEPGTRRYAIFICVDGIALSDEEEDEIQQAAIAWDDRLRAEGIRPFGTPLQPASGARTVRVRDGETLISDGPFIETEEFLAGIVVVDVPTLDDAVALAAAHPIARYHRLEVRPFHVD